MTDTSTTFILDSRDAWIFDQLDNEEAGRLIKEIMHGLNRGILYSKKAPWVIDSSGSVKLAYATLILLQRERHER